MKTKIKIPQTFEESLKIPEEDAEILMEKLTNPYSIRSKNTKFQ